MLVGTRLMAGAMRVCFVTPGHLSTDPRLVKEADAALGSGAQVSVVTGRFLPWAMQADAVFRDRPWRHVEVPFGPHSPRHVWIGQSLRRQASRALWWLTGGRAFGVPALHPAVGALERAARGIGADLYVAHNLAALPAAARAARAHGGAYAFDAEDDHVDELPDSPGHAAERRLRDAVLRGFLPGAAFTTASSPLIAAALQERYGRAFAVVRNVFPLADAAGLAEPAALPAPRFYWFSQTVGPGRGLEEWLEVIAAMRARTQLCLRGVPQPGFTGRLAAILARLGLPADTIEWQPVIEPTRVVRSCAGYAAGLSLELGVTANHRRTLANKTFSYLLAGTPVVLSDTPAHAALAAELGAAAVLIDLSRPREAAARLDAWLADAAGWLASARAAWRLARERFNWDVEQRVFLDLLAGAGAGA